MGDFLRTIVMGRLDPLFRISFSSIPSGDYGSIPLSQHPRAVMTKIFLASLLHPLHNARRQSLYD